MLAERYQRLKGILEQRRDDLTVLVERVEKAHNLAAIGRTADSVGCDHLHAITQHRKLSLRARAAMGTGKGLRVDIHHSAPEALSVLRDRGMQLVAAHLCDGALDYREVDYTRPTCLMFGEERYGLSPELAEAADAAVLLPMHGLAGSLNVSVAAALLLYEARRQREAVGMLERGTWSRERIDRTLFEWCHPEVATVLNRKGLPYPELGENGEVLDPNFAR